MGECILARGGAGQCVHSVQVGGADASHGAQLSLIQFVLHPTPALPACRLAVVVRDAEHHVGAADASEADLIAASANRVAELANTAPDGSHSAETALDAAVSMASRVGTELGGAVLQSMAARGGREGTVLDRHGTVAASVVNEATRSAFAGAYAVLLTRLTDELTALPPKAAAVVGDRMRVLGQLCSFCEPRDVWATYKLRRQLDLASEVPWRGLSGARSSRESGRRGRTPAARGTQDSAIVDALSSLTPPSGAVSAAALEQLYSVVLSHASEDARVLTGRGPLADRGVHMAGAGAKPAELLWELYGHPCAAALRCALEALGPVDRSTATAPRSAARASRTPGAMTDSAELEVAPGAHMDVASGAVTGGLGATAAGDNGGEAGMPGALSSPHATPQRGSGGASSGAGAGRGSPGAFGLSPLARAEALRRASVLFAHQLMTVIGEPPDAAEAAVIPHAFSFAEQLWGAHAPVVADVVQVLEASLKMEALLVRRLGASGVVEVNLADGGNSASATAGAGGALDAARLGFGSMGDAGSMAPAYGAGAASGVSIHAHHTRRPAHVLACTRLGSAPTPGDDDSIGGALVLESAVSIATLVSRVHWLCSDASSSSIVTAPVEPTSSEDGGVVVRGGKGAWLFACIAFELLPIVKEWLQRLGAALNAHLTANAEDHAAARRSGVHGHTHGTNHNHNHGHSHKRGAAAAAGDGGGSGGGATSVARRSGPPRFAPACVTALDRVAVLNGVMLVHRAWGDACRDLQLLGTPSSGTADDDDGYGDRDDRGGGHVAVGAGAAPRAAYTPGGTALPVEVAGGVHAARVLHTMLDTVVAKLHRDLVWSVRRQPSGAVAALAVGSAAWSHHKPFAYGKRPSYGVQAWLMHTRAALHDLAVASGRYLHAPPGRLRRASGAGTLALFGSGAGAGASSAAAAAGRRSSGGTKGAGVSNMDAAPDSAHCGAPGSLSGPTMAAANAAASSAARVVFAAALETSLAELCQFYLALVPSRARMPTFRLDVACIVSAVIALLPALDDPVGATRAAHLRVRRLAERLLVSMSLVAGPWEPVADCLRRLSHEVSTGLAATSAPSTPRGRPGQPFSTTLGPALGAFCRCVGVRDDAQDTTTPLRAAAASLAPVEAITRWGASLEALLSLTQALEWGAVLDRCTTAVSPTLGAGAVTVREAVLLVRRRHELMPWDYPPLAEWETNAAEVLRPLVDSLEVLHGLDTGEAVAAGGGGAAAAAGAPTAP